MFHDLSIAFRSIARAPRFALLICVVLGIGIGSSAVIWTAVRTALIDLPPVQDAESLVVVERTLVLEDGGRRTGTWFSYPLFETLRDASGVDAEVAAFTAAPTTYTLALPGQPGARTPIEFVSWNYFELLGVRPIGGRRFVSGDDEAGAAPVAILTHAAARRMFEDPQVAVGESVAVDGFVFTVVGVTAPGFSGLSEHAGAFVPMSAVPMLTFAHRLEQRLSFWHQVVLRGELAPGAAQVATDAFQGGSLAALEFSTMGLRTARGDARTTRTLWVAFAGVIALVLLACANAANLVMMRGTRRMQEFAVRIALGADRARLVREQMVEGAVIAVMSTIIAVAFAALTVAAIRQWAPGLTLGAMTLDAFTVDARMVASAAVVAVGTVMVAFLAPAYSAARRAGRGTREMGGRGSIPAAGARRILVGAEVAIATLLLVCAGLFLRSAINLQGVELGYQSAGVVVADIALPRADYRGEEVAAFHTAALEQVAAVPGVEASAFTFCPPPVGACDHILTDVDGGEQDIPVVFNQVSAGYFDTLSIPLVRGRGFADTDTADGAPVVVVSERAARALFGSSDAAVGGRVRLGVGWPAEESWAEVVGIVADIRDAGVASDPRPLVYTDRRQFAYGEGSLVVRSAVPTGVTGPLVEAIRTVDPAVAPWNLRTMEERLRVALARERLVTGFIGVFAAIALILAISGVFALLALTVEQRTREIGVRIAVGARRHDVISMVLREGVVLVALGTGAGLVAAQFLTGGLESLLFGLTPLDPGTRVLAFVIIVLSGVAGALLPARRASRIDPMQALREE